MKTRIDIHAESGLAHRLYVMSIKESEVTQMPQLLPDRSTLIMFVSACRQDAE